MMVMEQHCPLGDADFAALGAATQDKEDKTSPLVFLSLHDFLQQSHISSFDLSVIDQISTPRLWPKLRLQ